MGAPGNFLAGGYDMRGDVPTVGCVVDGQLDIEQTLLQLPVAFRSALRAQIAGHRIGEDKNDGQEQSGQYGVEEREIEH